MARIQDFPYEILLLFESRYADDFVQETDTYKVLNKRLEYLDHHQHALVQVYELAYEEEK